MTLPQIVATGNITHDPDFRVTAQGTAQLRFKIACNERKNVEGKWVDGRTVFVSVVCWRATAEQAAEALAKGDEVTVHGKLSIEDYTDKEGKQRTSVEIIADAVAHTFGRRKNATVRTLTRVPAAEEPF